VEKRRDFGYERNCCSMDNLVILLLELINLIDDCDFEWKDLAVRMEGCQISLAAAV
jgi:hypothetical protein